MRPTLAVIRGRLDRHFTNSFEQTRPNAIEAAARGRDMAAYVGRSDALSRDGYAEEAFDRLEDAQIAAARCLEALVGARLSQGFRSRAHVARKHFLVGALEAWGQTAPPIEALLRTTSLRNMLTYEFTAADAQFDDAAPLAAREATEWVAAAVTAIMSAEGDGDPPPEPAAT
jgi:hypothetical protein